MRPAAYRIVFGSCCEPLVRFFFVFFFFQAEDGIRDLTVTGVQTCALPISMSRWASAWRTLDWVAPPAKIGTFRVRPMLLVRASGDSEPEPVLSPQVAVLPQLPPSDRVGQWTPRAACTPA